MNEKKSPLKAFGGARGLALLIVGFALVSGYNLWDRREAHSALQAVASDLGLRFDGSGVFPKISGYLAEGYHVTVKTVSDGSGQRTWYGTEFRITAPHTPPGQIVGAGFRQRVIGAIAQHQPLHTGDEAFDEAVIVVGPPGPMLAHLDADARRAIMAATAEGWALQDNAWEAVLAGREGDTERIRAMLDLGMASAKAVQMEGDIDRALDELANTDPVPGVRATAGAILSGSIVNPAAASISSDPVLALQDPAQAFEAALVLADAGDDREDVRWALIAAISDRERQARAIEALAKVGGKLAVIALRGVTGEHRAAAQAAIAAIEARIGCSVPCPAGSGQEN